jgi:hypothetical protein
MQRLADLRNNIESLGEAIQVADDLARLTISLAVDKARAEKQIADLKARHGERTADARAKADALNERLTAFVIAHKDLFPEKRRKVVTELCSFGLQAVTELEITDQPVLLEHLLEQGYDDCLKVVRSPVKTAITARILGGESIPGAHVRSGDTAVYKVKPALVDEALQEV